MRLFAIGDLHLPGGPRLKAMDRFGEVWEGHVERFRAEWGSLAREGDVLLVTGDLSWGLKLDEAAEDIAFIAGLPGRKVVIRGNHDFWWSAIGKVRRAFGETVTALQADHVVIDRVAIVGTRGWQCPGEAGSADLMVDREGDAGSFAYTEHDERIYEREVGRLRLAFERLAKSGEEYETLVVALHYPPMNPAHEPSGFTDLIDEQGADLCVHGHLHGSAVATAFEGVRGRTRYHCVSADAVRMVPRLLVEKASDPISG